MKWRYGGAIAMLGEEPHRIDTGVDEVPGVDAQLQTVVDRVVEHPLDLVFELDVACRSAGAAPA